MHLLGHFDRWRFISVPRSSNEEADELANDAIAAHFDDSDFGLNVPEPDEPTWCPENSDTYEGDEPWYNLNAE